MVLDNVGKGNDTSRNWAQDSLLTVSGGKITKTQAYYVFRHFSQFVDPGATVLKTSGSTESVAFKNPDGSLVAVVYSSSAKSNYMVAFGDKKLQFSIPAGGWATVKYVKP
jgi:glucosylceramidase